MPPNYSEMSHTTLLALLRSLQAEPGTHSAAVEAERLLHDLQVHQIELEMQNRELRSTQQMLEESSARYIDLFDRAPIGYCTFGADGRLHEMNLTAAGMLGLARDGLDIDRLLASLPAAERGKLREHVLECVRLARRITTELTLGVTVEGPQIVQLVTLPVFGLGGRVVACRTTWTDISALKRSERSLRFIRDASEELASSLDYERTLATVVRLAVPLLADVCFVDLLEDDGRVRRLEIAFADESHRHMGEVIKRTVRHVGTTAFKHKSCVRVPRSWSPTVRLLRSPRRSSRRSVRHTLPCSSRSGSASARSA